jgi:hypothetical protein
MPRASDSSIARTRVSIESPAFEAQYALHPTSGFAAAPEDTLITTPPFGNKGTAWRNT